MQERSGRDELDASLPHIPLSDEAAASSDMAPTLPAGAPDPSAIPDPLSAAGVPDPAGAPDPSAIPDPLSAAGVPDPAGVPNPIDAEAGGGASFEYAMADHAEDAIAEAAIAEAAIAEAVSADDGPEGQPGPTAGTLADPYVPQIDYEVPGAPGPTGPSHRMTLRHALALLAIVAIGVTFALFLITMGFGLFAGSALPDVKGYAEQDARNLLQDSGIPFSIREQTTENVQDDGKVLATIPTAGESLPPGRRATLVIGKVATETQPAPDLVGLTESEALNAIASTKFFLKDDIAHAYSDSVEQGRVISQGPSAGSMRQRGAKIDLVISMGPKPDGNESSDDRGSLTIPDVKGMTRDEASELLRGMGLVVEYGEDVRETTAPNGTVVVVTPETGEAVREGSTVVIQTSMHEKRQVK